MKKCLWFSLLMAILACLIATPVWADMADPDSTPTVEQTNVYRNLLETGDSFYIWVSNIPYASTPTLTMPEAFVWRLRDGETELGSTTGYAYSTSGYGYNVYGMYFDAGSGLVWGSNYTLRLSGNPAAFADPEQYNYTVATSSYTSETTTAANQAALSARIIEIASDFDNKWGLSSAASLTLAGESGTVLSIYGETVFRGTINGVQALAPQAFRFVMEDIEATDRTWDTEYSDNLTDQYAGTWIAPARTGGGTLFGVGYDLTSWIIALILSVGLIYGNTKITNDGWNALIDLAVLWVAMPMIDLVPLTFTALVCSLFVLYEGTRIKVIVS